MILMPNNFRIGIDQANKRIEILRLELSKRRTFDSLARLARSIIYNRVKTGKGASGAKTTKLASLEPSTNAVRQGKGIMRTFNTKRGKKTVFIPGIDGRPESTGEFFSPGKSNLTFSGQMLDSITFKIRGTFGFTLYIPNSKRDPYKNNDVLNKQGPPTNREVAIYVQAGRDKPTKSKPRPFFELTKGETRIIMREYNQIIKRTIRRLNL